MYLDNNWLSPTPKQSTSLLLPIVDIVGGISKMLSVLKGPHLAPSILEPYESHFKDRMREVPAYHQIRTNGYVDPLELPPLIYLQNARLVLHRHNLVPGSESSHRSQALENCVSVAADTAKLLRRCMQEIPHEMQSHEAEKSDTWEKRINMAASSFMCTHLWRCSLFLCFRFEFECAIWCVRASAALGNSRPINAACGRNLEYFLREMITKLQQGHKLDSDEEMIAYVSGDLQGSPEGAWIWQSSPVDTQAAPAGNADDGPPGETRDDGPSTPKADEPIWSGWEKVLDLLDELFQEKQREQQHRVIEESSLRPPLVLPPLAPSPLAASSSNRMSIKDLI